MPDHDDDRVVRLARTLGVVQEAQRLGHRCVGTEHLLMATFADPLVRRALQAVHCDAREVQKLVTQASTRHNERGSDLDDPLAAAIRQGDVSDPRELQKLLAVVATHRRAVAEAAVELTPEARRLMAASLAGFPDVDPDGPIDPRVRSHLFGAAMIALLHADPDTTARGILDGLGLRGHVAEVTAAIRRHLEPPIPRPRSPLGARVDQASDR